MSDRDGRAHDPNGRAGPVEIAVNAESGIQDLRNLLVFCGPQAIRSLPAS
jgi:hypothetical protein